MRRLHYALALTLLLTAATMAAPQSRSTPYTELQTPMWTRFMDDTYRLALKHLRNDDWESSLNLINRDPFAARFALIRLLRSEETRPLGVRFAQGFTSNSASEIEGPLATMYLRLSPAQRDQTAEWMLAVSEAVFSMRADRPSAPDRAAETLHILESARASFQAEGFVDGEAYCLRLMAEQKLRLFQEESIRQAVDAYRQALSLYETTENTRGQALALIGIGNSFGRMEPQKQSEYWSQAKSKLHRAEDAFLLASNLESETSRLLPLLNSQPGLHLFKIQNFLNSFDVVDEKEVRKALDLLARETDPVTAVRIGRQLFVRLHAAGPAYHARAIAAFEQALHIAEELKYPGYAFGFIVGYPADSLLLRMRASLEQNAAHFAEAESSFSAALEGLEKSGVHSDYFEDYRQNLLNDLGALYALEGDLPKSLTKLAEALSLAERLDPTGAVASRALRSLALVHAQLGELRLAETLLRKGARVHIQGTVNPSLLSLAEIHVQFGRYADAIKDLEDMEPEFKGWVDNGIHLGEYASRTRLLALAWLRIGDLHRAAKFAKIFETNFGDIPFNLPGSVWLTERGLTGLVLLEGKKYSAAERYFSDRLAWAATLGNLQNIEEANALKGLTRAYRLQGRHSQAVNSAAKALEKYHTLRQPRDELEVHIELGQLALDSKDSETARQHFTQALSLADSAQSPQGVWSVRTGLANTALREGSIHEAIAHLEAAVDAIETVSSGLRFDLVKSTFIEDRIEVYDDLIRLLVSAGENEKAFEYAQRRRAQSFAQETQREGGFDATASDSALVKQMAEVQKRLIGKQKSLAQQMSAPNQDAELVSGLQKEVAEVQSQHSDMVRRVQQESPVDALRQGYVQPLTVREIQRDILKKDDVLIDYVVTSTDVFAIVISSSQFKVVKLKVSRALLAGEVQRLKRPFDRMRSGSTDLFHMDKYDVNLAQQIYREIVEPLGTAAESAKRWILLPDDILNHLPFESLVVNRPAVPPAAPSIKYGEYRDVNWVVRTHSVVYAIAVQTLRPNFRGAPPVSRTLLSVGNPQLGIRQLKSASMPVLASLPDSANEARSVAQILGQKGVQARVLVGSAANETAFSRDSAHAEYIHFAGHALLNEEQPYYSALMLAPDDQNDGWLQTYEISKMRLAARLVTLSGCDTGLGRIYKGEGVVGLRRAFLLAGAQSVAVSLWSVEDSVPGFMAAFYTNINKGLTLEEALRGAKSESLGKTMSVNGTKISLSHPFFWAPFTLASTSIQ